MAHTHAHALGHTYTPARYVARTLPVFLYFLHAEAISANIGLESAGDFDEFVIRVERDFPS